MMARSISPQGKNCCRLFRRAENHRWNLSRNAGLAQVQDDALIRGLCDQVVAESPEEVALFQGGKETLIGWFVGQVMRASRGKADAKIAKDILLEILYK